MYRDIPTDLLRVVDPVVRAHGLELVDASVKQGRGSARVLIVLDTAQGDGRVGVDDCARVSRELSHGLDAAALVAGSYTLEVSSPGVDRVLGREVDFERVVGREVRVETRAPVGGRSRFKGELVSFARGDAQLRTDTGDLSIPFAQIARAQAFQPRAEQRKGRGKG